MRILVIANKDPRLDMLHIVRDTHIDLIITTGDLKRSDIIMLMHINDIPKIGIYGSLSDDAYMQDLGIINIDNTIYEHLGLKFGGINNDSTHEMLQSLADVGIVVSYVNNPEDVTKYAAEIKPRLLLYNHSDKSQGDVEHMIDSTRVEYISGSKIITI